jgi:hypothetical protein
LHDGKKIMLMAMKAWCMMASNKEVADGKRSNNTWQ